MGNRLRNSLTRNPPFPHVTTLGRRSSGLTTIATSSHERGHWPPLALRYRTTTSPVHHSACAVSAWRNWNILTPRYPPSNTIPAMLAHAPQSLTPAVLISSHQRPHAASARAQCTRIPRDSRPPTPNIGSTGYAFPCSLLP